MSAPLFQGIDETALARLRTLAGEFLQRKDVQGAGGIELDAQARLSVAAQAVLPIFGLDMGWYRGWYSVILYPGAFRRRGELVDEAGVVHEASEVLAGEAWTQGPVILSWEDVVADLELAAPGSNVTVHECAHKLDLLNGGIANGFPPLHAGMSREAWTSAFAAAWRQHRDAVASGRDTWLDPYGAEDPGEFFATASELFFSAGAALAAEHPAVHQQLLAFYRMDPSSWQRPG